MRQYEIICTDSCLFRLIALLDSVFVLCRTKCEIDFIYKVILLAITMVVS